MDGGFLQAAEELVQGSQKRQGTTGCPLGVVPQECSRIKQGFSP